MAAENLNELELAIAIELFKWTGPEKREDGWYGVPPEESTPKPIPRYGDQNGTAKELVRGWLAINAKGFTLQVNEVNPSVVPPSVKLYPFKAKTGTGYEGYGYTEAEAMGRAALMAFRQSNSLKDNRPATPRKGGCCGG